MRLNKFIASASGLSRRAADEAVISGRVRVNDRIPSAGQQVDENDTVTLDGRLLVKPQDTFTIMLNKPAGYVCSRNGQGSRTIYDLLPPDLHDLKPAGRLDKDSSGLLLMTTDGQLAQSLTHPKYQKVKVYEAVLDKPLAPLHRQMISDHGVGLEDGVSQLALDRLGEDDSAWRVTLHEGRNRQIRRTFAALGYTVQRLHRTDFGPYTLGDLAAGKFSTII